MIATVQPHPLSEVARAIETACARHAELAREGVYLWRTGAAQADRDINQARKEAAYSEWRQLISEIGGES